MMRTLLDSAPPIAGTSQATCEAPLVGAALLPWPEPHQLLQLLALCLQQIQHVLITCFWYLIYKIRYCFNSCSHCSFCYPLYFPMSLPQLVLSIVLFPLLVGHVFVVNCLAQSLDLISWTDERKRNKMAFVPVTLPVTEFLSASQKKSRYYSNAPQKLTAEHKTASQNPFQHEITQ